MHTPLEKVPAVVRENVIAVFTDAGHRALNDLCRIEMRRTFIENPQWTSTRKVLERNDFNRRCTNHARIPGSR
jgi:hypothetical protein